MQDLNRSKLIFTIDHKEFCFEQDVFTLFINTNDEFSLQNSAITESGALILFKKVENHLLFKKGFINCKIKINNIEQDDGFILEKDEFEINNLKVKIKFNSYLKGANNKLIFEELKAIKSNIRFPLLEKEEKITNYLKESINFNNSIKELNNSSCNFQNFTEITSVKNAPEINLIKSLNKNLFLKATYFFNGIPLGQDFYELIENESVYCGSMKSNNCINLDWFNGPNFKLGTFKNNAFYLENKNLFNIEDQCLKQNENISLKYNFYEIRLEITFAPNDITDITIIDKFKEQQKEIIVCISCLLLFLLNTLITPNEELIQNKIAYTPITIMSEELDTLSEIENLQSTNTKPQNTENNPTKNKKVTKNETKMNKNFEKPMEVKKAPSLFSKKLNTKIVKQDSQNTMPNTNFASAASKTNNTDSNQSANDFFARKGKRRIASMSTGKNDPKLELTRYKTITKGNIDPELLKKLLKEYLPQFRHCYQRELDKKGENIEGSLKLNFRLNANGKISNVSINTSSAGFSGQGIDCMATVLNLIPFPSPKGGGIVDIEQPLNFWSERERT